MRGVGSGSVVPLDGDRLARGARVAIAVCVGVRVMRWGRVRRGRALVREAPPTASHRRVANAGAGKQVQQERLAWVRCKCAHLVRCIAAESHTAHCIRAGTRHRRRRVGGTTSGNRYRFDPAGRVHAMHAIGQTPRGIVHASRVHGARGVRAMRAGLPSAQRSGGQEGGFSTVRLERPTCT